MHQRGGPLARRDTAARGRRRRATLPALALTLAIGLLAQGAPAAADPGAAGASPRTPTRAELDAARERVGRTVRAVSAIQAALSMANHRLEAASVVAEQAAEAYNGARWRLHEATLRLQEARAADREARRSVVDQRARMAGLVVGSYETAGDLDTVEALLADSGPAGVMGRYLAADGASASMAAGLQRLTASSAVAQVFSDRAEESRRRQQRLAERARAARAQAAAAAEGARFAAVRIDAERSRLVAELARAQGISVRLARLRQAALEERARRAAEARRAREPARRQTRQQAQQAPQPPAELPAEQERDPVPASQPAPPAPVTVANPAPVRGPVRGGAARAIAFAKAQLGEPYVWGGAGPSTWDCSGLTMRAWQAAGVSLPHYSVAQYDATTPISAAALRPGDLVFWGTSSSPSSIHHVAMYLGDGMIIHAPRTGRPVSVDSMYYWVPPTFFGRV